MESKAEEDELMAAVVKLVETKTVEEKLVKAEVEMLSEAEVVQY